MKISDQNIPTDFTPQNFLISFFQTAKAVLLSPRLFYEGMKTEGGLLNPLLFLITCVAIHSAIAGLFLTIRPLLIINIGYAIAMPFITAGILFFILTKGFKVSGTYEMAFRVNAYAAATALLSWVSVAIKADASGATGPIDSLVALFGLLIEFYRLYLIAVGLSRTFSITITRAAVAIIITAIIYIFTLGPLMQSVMGPQQPGPPPPGGVDSPKTGMIESPSGIMASVKLPETCKPKT